MTPVTKYWVCKIGPALAYEAMECLGGNGYVEEGLAARLYRELPLNAIWEGSGNVMALDLLRVLQREPETVEIVMDDLAAAVGGDAHLKAHLARVQGLLHEPRLLDRRGRELAEALAMLAAGTILRAHAPPPSPTPSSARGCPARRARPTARASTGPIPAPSSTAPTRAGAGDACARQLCSGLAAAWRGRSRPAPR